MKPLFACAGALLCLWASAGHAQSAVYRCGADSRSYGQEPCTAGRMVEVDDVRSARQVAQARQVVLRDMQLADAMARERERRERETAPRAAAVIGAAVSAPPEVVRCHPAAKHCAGASGRRANKAPKPTLFRAPAPQ
jgi:hypothetical protein